MVTQASGANAFRISRTAGLIEFYLNGVKLNISTTNSQPMYLMVRANAGFDLKSTVNLLE